MVIVRVADWLIATEPLVDAERETMLVPRGVPGFPPLPPLHEIRPDATIRRTSKPKSRRPWSVFLRRAATLRISPRTGNRTAKVGRSEDGVGIRRAVLFIVVTVSVLLTAAPLGVTEGGLKLQAASEGNPLHAKLTCELNPFCGVTVNVAIPLCPLTMVSVVGLTDTWKLGLKV